MSAPPLPLRNIRVSEHAQLRYIERKHLLRQPTIDLDQLRAEILPTCPKMLAAIDLLGDGTYEVAGSHRVRIIDRVVVTVLPLDDGPPPPKPKSRHHSNK